MAARRAVQFGFQGRQKGAVTYVGEVRAAVGGAAKESVGGDVAIFSKTKKTLWPNVLSIKL